MLDCYVVRNDTCSVQFTITIRGVPVICNSLEALQAALTLAESTSPVPSVPATSDTDHRNRFMELLDGGLSDLQIAFLEFVRQHGLTDHHAAGEHFGLDGHSLGGMVRSLLRRIRTAGIPEEHVLRRSRRNRLSRYKAGPLLGGSEPIRSRAAPEMARTDIVVPDNHLPVPEFPDYTITPSGDVYHHSSGVEPIRIAQTLVNGSLRVVLTPPIGSGRTSRTVKRLLRETWWHPDRTDSTAAANPAAVALGRLGGSKGGKARAASLSKEQRIDIAKKAAAARWSHDRREEALTHPPPDNNNRPIEDR